MPKYSLSEQADVDIDEIEAYIAADNVDAALAFDARLTKVFEMLAEHDQAGRARPELSAGLRSFPEGNYLVFYRVWAQQVTIVRVLHAARDLDEIFS